MFSAEKALKVVIGEMDLQSLFEPLLESLIQNNNLNSAILLRIDSELEDIELVCCCNISCASLFGSKQEEFQGYITERFKLYPSPHLHKLPSEMHKIFSNIIESGDISHRACFIPALGSSSKYLLIGLFNLTGDEAEIDDINKDTLYVLNYVENISNVISLKSRLETLEKYVKEIGHDIASSVQATISKLRNMARGLYDSDTMKKKAKESEDEILGTFRVAEQLGIAVDPEYNIRNGVDFNILSSINSVVANLQSEANERHVDIDYTLPKGASQLTVWGDQKAIESALGQLILNAIKYSFGSSIIYVVLEESKSTITLKVTDKGIPINRSDISRLWEFGFRGRNALEKHVNGAGIGLFTVNKIVEAHGGSVFLAISNRSPNVKTFGFTIPKRDLLAKAKLF